LLVAVVLKASPRRHLERDDDRGLGMAFTNRATVPVAWNADARYYWRY
jgi:hypothetical protein